MSTTEQVSQSPKLRFLWLEVTEQCNLRCGHCYRESGPESPRFGTLTTMDWERVITEAHQEGCKAIQFIGGEPTLHPDLPRLIRYAKRHDLTVEVYTNGTRITEDQWSVFQECHVDLAFSYYGNNASDHDSMTTVNGSHHLTLRSMHRARDMGLNVRIGVIAKDPESQGIKDTLDALRADGFKNVGVDHVRGVGRGMKPAQTTNPHAEVCGNCWKGSLAIDPNGNAYPCVFSRFAPLGNVESGLTTLLEGVGHADFRAKLHEHQPEAFNTGACWPYTENPCNPKVCKPDCSPNSVGLSVDICSPCRPGCDPNTWCSP